MKRVDLLGNELTDTEVEIVECYEKLKAMSERSDLSPCVVSNMRHAAAALWQVVTDLNLDWEHPYKSGF